MILYDCIHATSLAEISALEAIIRLIVFTVDDTFQNVLDGPKMRGLKQMLITLHLYNNNKFCDGIKVERAHQIGKNEQIHHNNYKLLMKQGVSNKCFKRLSLIYMVNGGRWGSHWQYALSETARNLKDPDNAQAPHPALKPWLISSENHLMPKICATQFYSKKRLPRNYLQHIVDNECIRMMQVGFDNEQITMQSVKQSQHFKIQRIKNWKFQQSNHSFAMNFDSVNLGQQARCIVKINDAYVMEFTEAFQIEYEHYPPLYLCRGEYWPIHKPVDSDTWVNNGYQSMHFVNKHESAVGWNFMTNINEPVFLIHNCVQLNSNLIQKLPQPFANLNKYDWIQNKCYWSNRLHQYKHTHKTSQQLPCGPKWVCTKHELNVCAQCDTRIGVYCEPNWKLEWECNVDHEGTFWILDCQDGLVMTLMKSSHKHFQEI